MKILIVGNSSKVASIIEDIRQKDKDSEISLFCTESVLPYDRSLLPSWVAGEIKEHQAQPLSDQFFAQHRVSVIAGEEISRISVKRKHITTSQKKQISYDRLILADTGAVKLPDIKGHHKEGVFDPFRLRSVKAMIKYLPFADHVIVHVGHMQGLNMACALAGLGKEVIVVSKTAGILGDIFDDETGALLKQILETKGVRVMAEDAIEEILGDAAVKAVKFKSGKVMAAEVVVIDDVGLDLRMLSEETLAEGDEKVQEDDFPHQQMPLKPSHFGFKVIDGFCAGYTRLLESGGERMKFDGPQNIYKKIFVHGDRLAGAVLFNASSLEPKILQAIQTKESIAGREEELLSH